MRVALAIGCSLVLGMALLVSSCEGASTTRRRGDGGPHVDGSGDPGDGGGERADGGSVIPGCAAREICGNGLDDECNGEVDDNCECVDGQTQDCYVGPRELAGVGACRRGMQACERSGSEFASWGECGGETAPGTEACDGVEDEDCDGTVDEGCGCPLGTSRACYTSAAATIGVGPCRAGMQTCESAGGATEWGPCEGEITPRPELCDGGDYDCDGIVNSGCDCALGSMRSCYSGPDGSAGVGICREGAETCVPSDSGPGAMWGPCEGERLPEPDRCDGVDYSCTGVPGAGCGCILGRSRACYGGAPATRGVGLCRDGTNTCAAGSGGPGWSASCVGEQQPSTELCANGRDEDCDGAVDEGCGGTIMCPGDMTVPAGEPISLRVTSMGISSFSWRVVSAPLGGAATVVWAPSPPTAATESFTPYIVGDYDIEVSGTDASGRVVTCRFRVTALPHGLRVQLRWDGAGDIDLHVHDEVTSSPWFSSPSDCYYANTSPAWGASLDIDNTSANGPENVSMDTPRAGTTYTIAVHNYARGAGRRATIDVFCGSTTSTTPTASFTSRALTGSAAGNCTANEFWTVARVVFSSASTCTVTPIDTYRASSAACTTF